MDNEERTIQVPPGAQILIMNATADAEVIKATKNTEE